MRPEPRRMTLDDAMALSVGVAVAIAFPKFIGGGAFIPGLISPAVILLLSILMMIWAADMAVSFAILARSMRHGRMAGPGEWLALLLAEIGIVALAPSLFQAAEQPLVQSTGLDFSTARWLIAGVWTLEILAGLGLFALVHRRAPAWASLTLLVGLSVTAMGGPFSTLQQEGPFLINPVEILGNTPFGLLLLQCCELVETTPLLLMVAVPTMALHSRWPSRRSWPWTEWAGMILCLPTLAYAYSQRSTFFPDGGVFWFAGQVFGIAWLGVIAALGRLIVRGWRQIAQSQPTGLVPSDALSASTRAT